MLRHHQPVKSMPTESLREMETKRLWDIRNAIIEKRERRKRIAKIRAELSEKYKKRNDISTKGCHSCLYKGCDGLLCSKTGHLHSDDGVCKYYIKERWERAV